MSKAILQGLIGAWCPSLGPSGYTLLDRSKRANHAALVNTSATDWVGTSGGWALDLQSGQRAQITSGGSLLSGLSEGAIVAWLRPNTYASNGGAIAVWNGQGGNGVEQFALLWNLGGSNLFLAAVRGGSQINLGVSWSPGLGVFGCLVINFTASQNQIWINGVSAGTANASGALASSTARLDFGGYTASNNGDAVFGDVMVFNRFLREPEIRGLYQLGISGLGRLLTPQRRSYAFKVPAAAGNRRRRIICGAEC
jgi:hypothetical protein